ncbi:radical SAM/SPASM domain-containing protein [Magnetospirillum aberrantis]|uniref:Radical SAM protein n=1 Tax=Magnetospirillum aberrantis SpK TaxID=908842 RepID=A0A7C9QV13_9PROT|nr:radical SAM protein [Magnetospirillum aberrantis]NFV81182.1 radical SAM protein [Magnetospirillum aberrantis SpK]
MTTLQLDGTKLHHHMEAVAAWMRGETVYPILLEINPTKACNHACLFCAYDYIERQAVFLDVARTKALLEEMKGLGTKALFYSGEGEPLLHKGLPDLIEAAAALGYDQALNTNGSPLTAKVIERVVPHMSFIRCSVNGTDAQDYARVHRVPPEHYRSVLSNLEAVVAFKRANPGLETTLGVQFVYLGQPVEDVIAMAARLRDLGVDYLSVKQYNEHPFNDYRVGKPLPPPEAFEQVRALATERFHVTVRVGLREQDWVRPYKSCLALPFFAELMPDGEVYACGPHLNEKPFCYGNIHDGDFKTMWSKEGRAKVECHVQGIENLDDVCMPHCRLDQVNRFLWSLKNPPDHVNFI